MTPKKKRKKKTLRKVNFFCFVFLFRFASLVWFPFCLFLFFLNFVGVLYENGQGVVKNQKEAIKYYEQAAAQGNEYAKKKLVLLQPQSTVHIE